MNPLLQRLLSEASPLMQTGQLQAATEAIQRALAGGPLGGAGSAPFGTPASPFGPATPHAPTPAPAWPAHGLARATPDAPGMALDGCVREVPPSAGASPSGHAADAAPSASPGTGTASPSADAGAGTAEPWTEAHFHHEGRSLAYRLYVPPRAPGVAPTPRPLVLMLHGCTQNPLDFAAGTRMNALARAHGVVVLYPAQAARANPQQCWSWFKRPHQQRGRGEPALLAALTRSVMAQMPIDPARVYAAGLSAGGAMADILGHAYPELFAAVGVHSGLPLGAAGDLPGALAAMHSGPSGTFVPAAPQGDAARPAVIVFHGDADRTVHARNGAVVAQAACAGLGTAARPPRVTQGRSAHGQGFTRTDHLDAEGRTAVEHWQLHGAGHAWSGGSTQGSYTDPQGVDASAEMLRFFLEHPRAPR